MNALVVRRQVLHKLDEATVRSVILVRLSDGALGDEYVQEIALAIGESIGLLQLEQVPRAPEQPRRLADVAPVPEAKFVEKCLLNWRELLPVRYVSVEDRQDCHQIGFITWQVTATAELEICLEELAGELVLEDTRVARGFLAVVYEPQELLLSARLEIKDRLHQVVQVLVILRAVHQGEDLFGHLVVA